MRNSLKYSFEDNGDINQSSVNCMNQSCRFDYPCYDRTKCTPITIQFQPGQYFIKICGARGGHHFTYSFGSFTGRGGNGGCSQGTLDLSHQKQMYLYLGGIGFDVIDKWLMPYQGGWNGGGWSGWGALSGGGASDLRLLKSQTLNGLKSRIIVAGGGGGSNNYQNGGSGGGLAGGQGVCPGHENCQGGTQQTAGQEYYPGDFGHGGSLQNSQIHEGGAGGGGYFGGARSNGDSTSGGGGSGYVSGMEGCWSVTENDEVNVTTINTSTHYSKIVFINGSMDNGSNTFGPGYVEITGLDSYGVIEPETKKTRHVRQKLFLLALLFHVY